MECIDWPPGSTPHEQHTPPRSHRRGATPEQITLGEHHRDDFAISSPEVVLGAIAGRMTRILLGTGVTVLSSDDPVRVYKRFATFDGVSGGRAEVIFRRGSFTVRYMAPAPENLNMSLRDSQLGL